MPRPSHFNLDSSSNSELQELVQDLLAGMATLKQIVAEQRDEIARLKGGSGRPKINPNKPSGMEQASERKTQPNKDDNRRGRGRKKLLWAAIEDQIIAVGSVREGSRFKGYEDFTVEELVIQPKRCALPARPHRQAFTSDLTQHIAKPAQLQAG